MAAEELRAMLRADHQAALDFARGAGVRRVRAVLERAQADLDRRVKAALGRGLPSSSFTVVQMRATLAQVRLVLARVQRGVRDATVATSRAAADKAAQNVLKYLGEAERSFAGVGMQPLALRQAALLDRVAAGAEASVLRRLSSGAEHPSKRGILERYGTAVVGHFEDVLQRGVLTRKSVDEVAGELREKSPFLKGAPAHWAERIARTESMAASNRASRDAIRAADEDLGDMVQILSATFDDRTAADSYAVHGQVRRPGEDFATWYGPVAHPPARPNDREVVVPHRISWPIPPYLRPRSDAEVLARWRREKRRGAPPPRPPLTTVPFAQFGRRPPPKRGPQGG